MISWGFVAALTGFIHTAAQFYWARFLLGLAEAGFFPGLVVYLTHWYRDEDRGKAMGTFIASTAVASTIGAPISGLLMRLHWFGLSGWRWLLILEGLPAIIFGIVDVFLSNRLAQGCSVASRGREGLDHGRTGARETTPRARSQGKRLANISPSLRHSADRNLFPGQRGSVWLWLMAAETDSGGLRVQHVQSSHDRVSTFPDLVARDAARRVGIRTARASADGIPRLPSMLAGAGLVGSLWAGNRIIPGMVMFSIAAIGLNSRLPAFWALPHTFLGGTAAAASIGIINCIGGLGGFFGPYMLGALSTDRGNYSAGVWLLTGVSLLAAALVPAASASAREAVRFRQAAILSCFRRADAGSPPR